MRPFIVSHASDLRAQGDRELSPAEFAQVFGGEGQAEMNPEEPSIGFTQCIDKSGQVVLDPVIQDA